MYMGVGAGMMLFFLAKKGKEMQEAAEKVRLMDCLER